MTTAAYHVGDLRRLQATVKDIDDVLTDPSGLTLTIRQPDGTETVKTKGDLTNVSTGVYTYDFTITQRGRHFVRWAASGGVTEADQSEFYALGKTAG